MEDLKKYSDLTAELQVFPSSTITIITAKVGLTNRDNIENKNGTLLSTTVDVGVTYDSVYTQINSKGIVEEMLLEPEGILPTLFKNPNNETWVSLVPYHPDKELEVSIPIYRRSEIDLPDGNRPFVGEFIGISNENALFFDVDIWSNTKPDKLLNIEFKDSKIKKKHTIKLALPRNNKIVINNNEIHVIASENEQYLHRQIDAIGNELQRRVIDLSGSYITEVLSLSFNKASYFISEEDGKLCLIKVGVDSNCAITQLMDIEDEFYNTWQPHKLSENTFIVNFNGEFGNGWFVIRDESLLEFFYSRDVNGFKDLVSGEVIEMPFQNLVINGVNKTQNNAYAITLYPMEENGRRNNKLIIFNRSLL